MSGYTPHTEADVASMLGFLGLSSLDDLFAVVPEALRLAGGLDMPVGEAGFERNSPVPWAIGG